MINSISPSIYNYNRNIAVNPVRLVNRGKLPENHPWRLQAKKNAEKSSTSDKFKVGCYILGGAALLGTIIYACCTKKMTPVKKQNLNNLDEAGWNMTMVGDLIDQAAKL